MVAQSKKPYEKLLERIKSFFSFLTQTARNLSAVIGLLTFLGVSSIIYGFIRNTVPIIIVGVFISILVTLLSIFLYTFIIESKKKVSANIIPAVPTYPPFSPPSGVNLILKEIVYQYDTDEQTMRMRRRFVVKALRDGITHFTDRYRWTGIGKCDVKSISPGFIVVNQRREEFWDVFDVQFPHPVRSGQIVDFTIEWDLFDQEKRAVPFLSTPIDLETQRLLMRVLLPLSLAPKRAYGYDFENYVDQLPINVEELQWDAATQEITYDINEPKRNHKYVIRWYKS